MTTNWQKEITAIVGETLLTIRFLYGRAEFKEPVWHTRDSADFYRLTGGIGPGKIYEDKTMPAGILECRSTGSRITW